MKEYKITKERLKAMAEECPEAEGILKKGFPEAFKVEEWVDITKEIEWKLYPDYSGSFWVRGYHKDKAIVWLDAEGINDFGLSEIKVEKEDMSFRILKRQGE